MDTKQLLTGTRLQRQLRSPDSLSLTPHRAQSRECPDHMWLWQPPIPLPAGCPIHVTDAATHAILALGGANRAKARPALTALVAFMYSRPPTAMP